MTGSDQRPALVLLPSLAIGGSERKFVRMTNALAARGLPIHLGYFNEPETLLAEVDPSVTVLALRRQGKYSLSSLRRLCNHIRDNQIGTVVGVNFYPLSYMVLAAILLRRRDVSWISSINTTKFVLERDERFMPINAPLLRRMDRIVFGNRGQLEHWVETYRLDPARADVIYNGVDVDAFARDSVARTRDAIRGQMGYGAADFVLVCVGLLRAEKGQMDLIDAVALASKRLADSGRRLRLLLVGDGPLRDEIMGRAAALGIAERVAMTGTVEDVRPQLKAADAFALPSHSETFSNAALEAAAMGLPLLLSDVSGNRELVARGDCGRLFPPADPEALAACVEALVSDDEHRRRLADRARASVCEYFSLEGMTDEWARLLWPSICEEPRAGDRAAPDASRQPASWSQLPQAGSPRE